MNYLNTELQKLLEQEKKEDEFEEKIEKSLDEIKEINNKIPGNFKIGDIVRFWIASKQCEILRYGVVISGCDNKVTIVRIQNINGFGDYFSHYHILPEKLQRVSIFNGSIYNKDL